MIRVYCERCGKAIDEKKANCIYTKHNYIICCDTCFAELMRTQAHIKELKQQRRFLKQYLYIKDSDFRLAKLKYIDLSKGTELEKKYQEYINLDIRIKELRNGH